MKSPLHPVVTIRLNEVILVASVHLGAHNLINKQVAASNPLKTGPGWSFSQESWMCADGTQSSPLELHQDPRDRMGFTSFISVRGPLIPFIFNAKKQIQESLAMCSAPHSWCVAGPQPDH